VTAVDAGLSELEQFGIADDWADRLVEATAFRHIARSPECRGYTIVSSGRSLCGNCEWQLSGRMSDAGELRSARFALAALATIGLAVEAAEEARHGQRSGFRNFPGSFF
jgi:hypothetical protein